MPQRWERLVRFISDNGKVYVGDAILPTNESDVRLSRYARELIGDPLGSYALTKPRKIIELLAPLTLPQIRTVRCLGLNFKTHISEVDLEAPKHPVIITKPATAISGPVDHIPVPVMAQAEGAVDYEVELVVLIGRQCRYVSEDEALDYVAGYTVGNDLSQREWQMNRGSGQWNVSKMFDGWAPIGPAIVAARNLDPTDLNLSSWVNDEQRQSDNSKSLLFSVSQTISWLSQGCTLLPGDLLFMGTPSGVGMGFKPPKWLQDGDIVECRIDGIGTIRNRIAFESYPEKRKEKEAPYWSTRSKSAKL